MRFINRESELTWLEERYQGDAAEFVVVYGRRRVGKTYLLRRFCADKPHLHFQAGEVADADNLRRFSQEMVGAIGARLSGGIEFADWEAALEFLLEQVRGRRFIVVLDEFPFLCEANPALPSLIQRFWDLRGQHSDLFVVLSGSSVSFMENEVLSERSPLFGRRTGQIHLLPMSYRDAAEFVPGYSPEDKLRVYGIVGGIPMYLARFQDGRSLAGNVCAEILDPKSLLYEEPEHILRAELRDPPTYSSILHAIATGQTRRSEINNRVAQAGRQVDLGRYLRVLEQLRLIERVAPLTSRGRKRPGRGRYFIADNFLRFWYRFVLPNRSRLEIGMPEEVWREDIEPHLDDYMGLAFEQICRDYVRRFAAEKLPVQAKEVGVFWHKNGEIDVLSLNTDGSVYCGECKWSRQPMDLRELEALVRKTALLPEDWREREIRYVLFCRGGFTDDLRRREDGERLILVTLEDLLPED